jgi:hypothetical protein
MDLPQGEIQDSRPLVERIPPPTVASPSELRPRDPTDIRWYKPGFEETLKLMGWRWMYFLPAVGLLARVFLVPIQVWLTQIVFVYWKLLLIAVVLPCIVFVNTAKHIIRKRTEPFCIHCGYDLTSLPDNYICPECGERFSHRVIDEYRRDPHWFIERYKRQGEIPMRDVPFEARKSSGKKKRSRDGT